MPQCPMPNAQSPIPNPQSPIPNPRRLLIKNVDICCFQLNTQQFIA
ncbi:hypothetical protein FDUTEX481_03825 [Tolypothrix sp. PCC 7601]|nr:hypothetical protein FDUTEX481_03825 [Tolypothrix sp. PCC 7601]